MTLALAAFFPTAGHAAAWGVLLAGVLEVLLVAGDAARQGVLPRFRWPRLDVEVKMFLKRFGPATVGSAETQIALFADTIIASFLAAGALSALYYADRLNQLPIGVIGIAAGTVLLPEMARRIAAGDEAGARHSQNRAIELTLLLSVPCMVAFLTGAGADHARAVRPRRLHRGRRARRRADADGLCGRSPAVRADAQRDGDVPVARRHHDAGQGAVRRGRRQRRAEILLMDRFAQVGLALATSVGAWINLLLLVWFAARQNLLTIDRRLKQSAAKIAIAGGALALALLICERPVASLFANLPLRDEATLLVLGVIGVVVYGGVLLALFGRQRLASLQRPPAPRDE